MGVEYTVVEVLVYPVKACRGVSVSSAAISSTGDLGASGFLLDREWMVVKAVNGRTVAMSRAPKLALVQPSLPEAALRGEPVPSNATLEINAPGMRTLTVPLGRKARCNLLDVGFLSVFHGQGVDEGPEAAAWFSHYLDLAVHLVRFDPIKQKEKRQAEEAPAGYVTGFQNTGQFLFVSEASLDKVNSYIPTAPFPMNRFRPNVVVRGPPSFEEDKWRKFATKHRGDQLNFSSASLRAICKCQPSTRISQDLDIVEPNKAYFGSYFVCDSTLSIGSVSKGKVHVGDRIDVISKK